MRAELSTKGALRGVDKMEGIEFVGTASDDKEIIKMSGNANMMAGELL